jgi:hypothetical protein
MLSIPTSFYGEFELSAINFLHLSSPFTVFVVHSLSGISRISRISRFSRFPTAPPPGLQRQILHNHLEYYEYLLKKAAFSIRRSQNLIQPEGTIYSI